MLTRCSNGDRSFSSTEGRKEERKIANKGFHFWLEDRENRRSEGGEANRREERCLPCFEVGRLQAAERRWLILLQQFR